MSTEPLISRIIELSKIDSSILRIISERKTLQKKFDLLTKEVEGLKKEVLTLQTQSSEAKTKYEKETRQVKIEKESLAARRRALATLGNYKLQQAAAKEIDASEKTLNEHEDKLIVLLDSSEQADKLATEKELLLLDKDQEKSDLIKDLKPTLDTLSEREEKLNVERAAIISQIDSKDLAIYEGVKNKLAPDTLAPIISGACDFCNLQTPPQMVILVNAGNSLQKCRGCSRILFVPKE